MWVSAPGVTESIMESLQGQVPALKSQCCLIHHKTLYDGAFEKVSWVYLVRVASAPQRLEGQSSNSRLF